MRESKGWVPADRKDWSIKRGLSGKEPVTVGGMARYVAIRAVNMLICNIKAYLKLTKSHYGASFLIGIFVINLCLLNEYAALKRFKMLKKLLIDG